MTSTPAWPIRLALALFAVIATSGSAAELSPIPTRFSAHIGGFLNVSYGVELRDGTITYTKSSGGGSKQEHRTISPTAAQWREFRETLDELKVWQWQAEYS